MNKFIKKFVAIGICLVSLIVIVWITQKHDNENITTANDESISDNIIEQQAEVTKESNHLQDAIANDELKRLYELFLKYYASRKSWTYAYHDSDEDGQEELYILSPQNKTGGGYIVRYKKNGLQLCLEKEFSSEICDLLVWNSMPEDESIIGIEVYSEQDVYNECHYWFENEESMLSGFGFDDTLLLYEYWDDNVKRLVLYFNEESGEGCGIRYTGNDGESIYGFVFDDVTKEEWTGFLTEYDKQISIYGFSGDGYVSDFNEEFTYDSEGKLIEYVSSGLYDDRTEREKVLEFHYEYYQNNVLKYRYYYHNPYIFGTTSGTRESFFDELGRVEYEQAYITHGSLEYYYIYSGGEMTPKYVLVLDYNLGAFLPEFTCY